MAEKKEPPYFMYFPGNYRWSAGFINMLSSAPYGGSEIGELHKIGSRLKDKAPEDDQAWFDACVSVADGVRAHASKFENGGHRYSAAHAYLRACNYYQMAERFRTPKDDAALAAFRAGVDCFHRHIGLTDVKIEIVEVPFKGGSLPGYFVHAQNAKSKKTPCVVYFDGLDVTKEIQYVRGVPDLIKRGISCLVMDGPGTGEAIRFRGQYLRHDYEVAGSACLDWLEKRDDVDARKIGIVAISL
ncbi:MAG: alpha/beta hydrolase, partial [Burkholderiales bacterium]|nr:alpha/beta hydrolase [Burkholderiales bacterium]